MIRLPVVVCSALAFMLAVSALPARAADPAFLTVGGGYYDINDNQDAAEFRVEIRRADKIGIFKPFYGLMGTSDRAFYGYGGLLVDIFFGKRVVLTPNFAAGLYADGDGKDLGHAVEFRSALDLAWRFDNHARLGLSFYHISNASISSNNPGTEVLSVVYSIPLR